MDERLPDPNPYSPPRLPPVRRFGIAGMMLMIATIAFCLAVIRVSPGVGILCFVISVPAMLRAGSLVRRRVDQGARLGMIDRTAALLGSVLVVCLLLVCSGITFFGSCFGGVFLGSTVSEALGARQYDPLGWGLAAGFFTGSLAALSVAFWIGRRTWRKDWPHIPIDERPGEPELMRDVNDPPRSTQGQKERQD